MNSFNPMQSAHLSLDSSVLILCCYLVYFIQLIVTFYIIVDRFSIVHSYCRIQWHYNPKRLHFKGHFPLVQINDLIRIIDQSIPSSAWYGLLPSTISITLKFANALTLSISTVTPYNHPMGMIFYWFTI